MTRSTATCSVAVSLARKAGLTEDHWRSALALCEANVVRFEGIELAVRGGEVDLSTSLAVGRADTDQARFVFACRAVAAALLRSGFLLRGKIDVVERMTPADRRLPVEVDAAAASPTWVDGEAGLYLADDVARALPEWAKSELLEGASKGVEIYHEFYTGREVAMPDVTAFAEVARHLSRLRVVGSGLVVVASALAQYDRAVRLAAQWPGFHAPMDMG